MAEPTRTVPGIVDWQHTAITLASLLPDDFNVSNLWDGHLSSHDAELIVKLIQTIKGAFDE